MAATHTVSGLVARFQLRRRAPTDVFAAGVQLARLGVVTLDAVTPTELRATVTDLVPVTVRLCIEGGQLTGTCDCQGGAPSICRHQVAAAHALWVRDRRHSSGPT